jgi:hypothetical protein
MKDWRCRLGWHRWVKQTNDDGQQYLVCARCGKYDDVPWRPIMG